MLSALRPPPPAPAVPPEQVDAAYRYWRVRQLLCPFIGYAIYYCVRLNMPVAVPLMTQELGLKKTDFGMFFTLHGLVYGLSKLVHGLWADRMNPRVLVSFCLLMSAVCNLAFGASSSLLMLGTLWVLNGWFQGGGFPPCARVLAYWFAPRERGVKWGIFNTSHQIGTAFILFLTGYLATNYGWRSCFYVPAVMAIVCSVFLWVTVRDTPESLGLPTVERWLGEPGADAPASQAATADIIRRRVFLNPIMWAVCLGNFLVYVVRYCVLNWAPSYLTEVKHMRLEHAGGLTAGFEIAGLVGCLLAGWITDRFLGGRRAPMCVLCMIVSTISVLLFWKVPEGHPWLDLLCLGGIGFSIYGPQFLVGVLVADQATKRATASAVGLSGFFGYLSGAVSGMGLAHVVEKWGWDGGFTLIAGCSAFAVVPFALCWNAGPVKEEDA